LLSFHHLLLLLLLLLLCQKRANNDLLTEEDLERLFKDHITTLSKVATSAISAALDQHLAPLLPAPLAAAAAGSSDATTAAAAEAWRRGGGSTRDLHETLRRFDSVDDLLNNEGDDRWIRQPEELR
jgi:hypothetical protein